MIASNRRGHPERSELCRDHWHATSGSIGFASSVRPTVTNVSDKAAEVEQRLSDAVRRDVDADELGSMDPFSIYGSCE